MITTAFVVADIAPRTEKEGEREGATGVLPPRRRRRTPETEPARRNEDGAIQI